MSKSYKHTRNGDDFYDELCLSNKQNKTDIRNSRKAKEKARSNGFIDVPVVLF